MDQTNTTDTTHRIEQLLTRNAKFIDLMRSFSVASVLTALAHEKHQGNEEQVRRGNAGMGALEITQNELRHAETVRTTLLNDIRAILVEAFDPDTGQLKEGWNTIGFGAQQSPQPQGVGAGSTR